MQSVPVKFGKWLPDQPDYENPGLIEANNCYPVSGGYGPYEGPVASSDTTSERVLGAQRFYKNSGDGLIVGGGSTTLFVRDGGGITETTGLNALGNTSLWRFARFNDLIIGVSRENDPQYLTDLNTDTTFSDLPGTPPRAAVVGVVLEWLVMGDLIDVPEAGGADVPYRVRWGAFNNPTSNWVTDRGEQSDFRDLPRQFGRVTAIVGGRFGLVFQERAIWRMRYVGAPKVFEFDLVTDETGCVAGSSPVTIGFRTYFLDRSGFFVTNGSDVDRVGDERVNAWFGENVSSSERSLTCGALNWAKRCIVWSFYTGASDQYDKQIIYSFVTDNWTTSNQTVHFPLPTSNDALTLGDLDALYPGGLGVMSEFELGNLDWKGGSDAFAIFEASGNGSVFSNMTGPALQADFVTGDRAFMDGRRSLVSGIMPHVELEAGTVETTIRSRARLGGPLTLTGPSVPGADQYCPHKVDSWFHSVRMTLLTGASWDKAQGFWARVRATGKR